MSDVAELDRILAAGADRAREVASRTLAQVWILATLVVAGLPLLWWARTTAARGTPSPGDRD